MDSHVSVNAPDSTSGGGGGSALKEKLRSFGTLTTLYHESRQEMELLHKQVHMKDNVITDLKARLARYERIYLTPAAAAADPEAAAAASAASVSVGPSKSLLESLCREICSLKAERSEHELGATRLREEVQRLKVQLREKDLELERVRCQPDHHKDLEIQRLRSALEERERSEATRAVLYSSLAEEADRLRAQLAATVKVCQELLSRLGTDQTKGDGAAPVQRPKDSKSAESPDAGLVAAKLVQLQEENKQLKQRVTYVQGLNSQWQKYDSSREDYIRGLCQRLKESSGPGLALLPGLGSVSAALLHQEIARLNHLLEEKISEGSRLGREAEEARRKDQDRIQTLEQQVLIYADDFKSERRDRERAQGQIQDLKEQMYQLKQQLHRQQGAPKDRDLVPMCRVHIGHRISTRRHKDNVDHLLRSSAQTQQPAAAAVTAAAAAAAVVVPPLVAEAAVTPPPAWSECLSELQCPRCQAKFSDAHTVEYLKHWEECAKL